MFHVFSCKEDDLNNQYQELNDVILQHGFYQYIDIYSYFPIDIMKRYQFLKNLQLTCSIGIYRYAQGNYLGLPKYFTWQMKKNVLSKYFLIKNVTPAVLQMLYFNLTGNAAVTSNTISHEIEEKLHLILKTPAVNDQLHDTTMHMPLAISIHNLCNIILAKLHIKNGEPLPAEIYIPSSIQYTERYQVKFKVQGRFLLDLFYIRYKVPIGESVLVFTGVRNHQSLATQNNDLNVFDYNFTKLSLTPSVIFFVFIPNDISDEFYNGQVFVSFKDTVFKPNSAIQHITEF
ncbi:hypothetical protein RhiirA5_405442 [Rhizophagus irregularis]|uniref:Uncharacterized protein n=1 Tax=Rhizophagus irregularis TaxID=588596 RepID=A0A2N0QFL0_9GLOM|nr:hypothetical protein RhiirA5_405442 [Rhizophagus irregularis]